MDRGPGRVWGIGVDAVDVARFKAAAERRTRLVPRVFDDDEIQYAGDGKNRWQRLAARFAAKEAVVKAAGGFRGSAWRQIVVGGRLNQPPPVSIRGPLGEWLDAHHLTVLVSMTHEHDVAVAVAVLQTAEEEP